MNITITVKRMKIASLKKGTLVKYNTMNLKRRLFMIAKSIPQYTPSFVFVGVIGSPKCVLPNFNPPNKAPTSHEYAIITTTKLIYVNPTSLLLM